MTGDMALRFEMAFGLKLETLLGMQSAYDVFRARQRASKIGGRRFETLAPAH